jgi:phosphate/phosphite/phosphonate ABC transporter binding protein
VTARRIAFGLVVPTAGGELPVRVDRLAALVGGHAGVVIERRDAPSYEALADDVRAGRVDLAWLPPIVYVRLADVVTPMGSILRGGQTSYEAALVVKADSRIKTIDALGSTRAGWVDPWSAAGFVMPRVKLALLGVDPRTVFRTEVFHGSHRAAMRALADGACDVAGTYARSDEKGKIVSGAWSEQGLEVRVLATFGAIPPDVIATRRGFPDDERATLLAALRRACAEESAAVRAVFSGDELHEGLADGYDTLRTSLDLATARGLFD